MIFDIGRLGRFHKWKIVLGAMLIFFVTGAARASTIAAYWDQSGAHSLGGQDAAALAINNAGWIVGLSGNRAALWKNGQFTDLGVLPGDDFSIATGVNNSGLITGYSDLGGNNVHFFLYDGSMHDLGPGLATGINDLGQIIGYTSSGFVWTNGATSPITAPQGFLPLGINNVGQIVGGNGQPFLISGSTITSIPKLPGLSNGWAQHINDLGQVVGSSFGPSNDTPYIWSGGASSVPIAPAGSEAEWINNQGVVVGSYSNFGHTEAYRWQNGTLTTLPGPYGGFSRANAINDLGVVVGVADTPEPMTALLVVIGTVAMIVRRLRFRLRISR